MTITVYSSTGAKKGTIELPADLFGGPVNQGLMHQAVLMQQGNRRDAVAHVKTRGEIVGSTKKIYQQKHTGRARRGPIRSPLMRGGGKTFGPRSVANFTRQMPKKMRHAAIRSCLAFQAKKNAVLALEGYPEETKTKTAHSLLTKLPIELGRPVLIVAPAANKHLTLSMRNLPTVKTVLASYLSAEDIVHARAVIFVGDAMEVARKVFVDGLQEKVSKKAVAAATEESEKPVAKKKAAAKPKAPAKKKSSASSKN